jgi:coproporphyrinogen III oxidase
MVFEVLKLSPLYKWVYGTADKDSFVAIDKAKVKLGWQPKYSNAEALCRTYDWYLAHRKELQGLTGLTHRVAWSQGVLRIFRDLLPSGKKETAQKLPALIRGENEP